MRVPVRSSFALVAAAIIAGGSMAAAPPVSADTLAAGVTLAHRSFTFEGHRQSVWTIRVSLSAHTRLVTTTPHRQIGGTRLNLLALSEQEKAVAGINGDTLYYVDPTVQPHSGVAYQGRTLKSPIHGQNSVLYTTRAGNAYIGNVDFGGELVTGPNRLKTINTYNSLENAKNGGLTFTSDALLSRSSMRSIGSESARKVTPHCTFVGLHPAAEVGRYTVTSLRKNLTSYPRVATGQRGLFTCGGVNKSYLAERIRVGHTVTANVHYAVPNVVSMISGVRKLIAGGKAYDDRTGLNDLGPSMLPESFVCILPDARTVLLGAVEGRKPGASGMTYAQLTRYLLTLHCGAAMAMDGSTDSELVARRPGKALAFQNHLSYKNGRTPNGLVSALVVVHS